MLKYIILGLAFLMVTLPGAVSSWLSLYDRFFGKVNEPVIISVTDWYSAIFPLLGFTVLMFGIWWTRPRKTETAFKEIDIAPVADPEERKRADWMAAALNRDEENFEECLRIEINPKQIRWQNFLGKRPYLKFPFRVHSSSVFIVAIESIVRGYLFIDEDMDKEPVITSEIKELHRSNYETLVIRQWFSAETRDELLEPEGKKVNFNFGKVVVKVTTKRPDGTDGPNYEMTLPAIPVIVPTRKIIEK